MKDRFLFRIFRYLFLLIIVVLLAEFVLRLSVSREGDSSRLFITDRNNNEILIPNPNFQLLYGLMPEKQMGFTNSFKKKKDENTFRIFVLSPYKDSLNPENLNASFTHILNHYLQASVQNQNIELININPGSSSSFIQYNIAKQLSDYEADLVLLFPGTDEFYGAQTNGSGSFVKGKIWLSRTTSFLMESRVFQCVNMLLGTSLSGTNPEYYAHSKMAVLDNFDTNLLDIVDLLKEKNIDVVLFGTASNLKDQPPVKSSFGSGDATSLQAKFEKGLLSFQRANYSAAHKYFSGILKKDKEHAATYFYLGKIELLNGNTALAEKYFEMAADLDLKPIRPVSDINQIIFKTAVITQCPYIDISKIYAAHACENIPGNEFFNGKTTANMTANVLVAKECLNTLTEIFPKEISFNRYNIKELAILSFDTFYDNLCSVSENGLQNRLNITSNTFEENIAMSFARGKINWQDSMNTLYEHYIKSKKYEYALKVVENLALENPNDLEVVSNVSKLADMLGDSQKVVKYAKRIFMVKPSYDTAQQLLIGYLKMDMPESAMPYIKYAMNNKPVNVDLDLIYSSTVAIIDLKKLLKHKPMDNTIRKKVADYYYAMGNADIALQYLN